jgi:hypothetical protein
MKGIITRVYFSDEGTPGTLRIPGFACRTLELPWRDNQVNISCIPEGIYVCKFRVSPKFGPCYHFQDVKGRTWVLTHWGNLAGDREKGFKSHTHGCVLLGSRMGRLYGQLAVLYSKPTFNEFMRVMNKQDIEMTVRSWEVENGLSVSIG